jgi:tetratricopeptide (TPR) repeat protein
MCTGRIILMYSLIALMWLCAGFSYAEQGRSVKEIDPEQREKAYAILKQALAIAEEPDETETSVYRSGMPLGTIVTVLARIDIDKALAIIDKIPSTIAFPKVYADEPFAIDDNVLSDPFGYGKAIMLARILPEGGKIDEERVMEVFDGIISIADNLANVSEKSDGGEDWAGLALLMVAGAMAQAIGTIAKTDLDLALAITDKIKDDGTAGTFMKLMSLIHIAGAIAKADADRALEIASRIRGDEVGPHMKSLALIYVAGEIAEGDRERAQTVLNEALEAVEGSKEGDLGFLMDHEMWRFPVAVAIARVDTDKAFALTEGMRSKHGRYESDERIRVLTQILTEVAKTDMDRALEAARGEPYPARAELLVQIGKIIAETDPEKALAIADEIGRMKYVEAKVKLPRAEIISAAALEIGKSDRQRGLGLMEQAWDIYSGSGQEAVYRAGMIATMTAKIDVDTALEMAEKIGNSIQRSMILSSVAVMVARTDPDKALIIAENIEEDSSRAMALSGITWGIAQRDPDAALTIAERIKEDYWKVQALCNIAAAILGFDIHSEMERMMTE